MAQNNPQSSMDSALDSLAVGLASAGPAARPIGGSGIHDYVGVAGGVNRGGDNLGFNTPTSDTLAPAATTQDVLDAATAQTELLKNYYADVLNQSRSSFTAALVCAIAGFIVFLVGLYLLYSNTNSSSLITVGTVSTVGGIIIQVISGLFFYLYARTTTQLSSFHIRLLRVQRFLLANKICDSIADAAARDGSRAKLVDEIATASADIGVADAPLPTGK